jgi:hypothetical protein
MRLITIKYKYVHPFSNVTYSPDKINVNPDFIKSNYLTACSNKNVKMTIVKIYDGEQMVTYHQSCR